MQTGSDIITKNSNKQVELLAELKRTDSQANAISSHFRHLGSVERDEVAAYVH